MIGHLTLAAGALGAAVSGGALYAFSSFVMPGLSRISAEHGIPAMQAINRAAPTPTFMVPLFGTTLLAVGLGIQALSNLQSPGARAQLVGACFYFCATLVTTGYNLPRNNVLARLEIGSDGAGRTWSIYVSEWTAANHVRSIASLAAGTFWAGSLWQRAAA